ncbi:hypothetical protein ABK01_05555 [Treponema sp. OMZ 305]|nr:hypothetical protein ABK01_05555 [Treponema sp. OMZ 305]
MKNSKFRNIQGRTSLNDGIPAATANPQRIRTDTDVREIKQQRVCPANSTLNSVHGRTLFNSATDGGDSMQKRVCPANSSLSSVQGRTLLNSLFPKALERLFRTDSWRYRRGSMFCTVDSHVNSDCFTSA